MRLMENFTRRWFVTLASRCLENQQIGEGANNRKREEALIVHRESDCLVLLMMAGNAAGGKEATHGQAM